MDNVKSVRILKYEIPDYTVASVDGKEQSLGISIVGSEQEHTVVFFLYEIPDYAHVQHGLGLELEPNAYVGKSSMNMTDYLI